MPDINVHRIELSDEQRTQRHLSKDKLRFSWESLSYTGLGGLVVGVALFVLGKCFWDMDIGALFSMIAGGVIGMALGFISERRRLKLIPEDDRRWHNEYIALCGEIERFSARLEAFRCLAKTFDKPQEEHRTIIRKYSTERDALAERMQIFRRAMALVHFEAVVASNTDGRFRDTRDVTEQVFIRQVRVAQEQAEINTLLTDGTPESPNEEQFRQLEEQYGNDDDAPVSNAKLARRGS